MTAKLTIRRPEDAIGYVPQVLGFHPQDSVVMLTFGAASPFHARVDMPTTMDEVHELARALVEPCTRHGVARVLFAVFTDRPPVDHFEATLTSAFETAAIDVIDIVYSGNEPTTTPQECENVLAGRPAVGLSRDALRERMAPSGKPVEATEEPERVTPEALQWMHDQIACGQALNDSDLSRFVGNLADKRFRDAAIAASGHANVEALPLWCSILKRTPGSHVDYVAPVAAFAAWQYGDGASAWIALDFCEGESSLAQLMHEALTQAVPPDAWPTEGILAALIADCH